MARDLRPRELAGEEAEHFEFALAQWFDQVAVAVAVVRFRDAWPRGSAEVPKVRSVSPARLLGS